ncbi:serine proteinase inhibitor [Arthrobacter sp. NicSoilB4]|uniref:serpin family protein n=1 Tax=Arthrobacter sp. NicSoilB4 TaxID=2830997 RepID=UPI001CC48064|nr:serpin family protein [Arthrobacter sp. NicSoilB4]BCW65682.1 serine proteinase inhibitor [Arthrobacter sp. NicSoilB4]
MRQKTTARLVAAGAALALALTACSASPPALVQADGVERVSAEESAYPAELALLRASARKLGAALLTDGGDAGSGNVVSSPGSLLVALAMLRVGASGATAAEMDSVLGFPAEHRDEALNALLTSLEAFDGDPGSVDEKDPPRRPVLHTANGLFVDKGEPTGERYLQSLARYYGTGVYPVDFQDEAATKPAIDAWVNQNTGGRIKEAPAKYDRRDTFSVLNAVYFASAWKVPFDPADTSDLPFTTSDGGQVSVPTMSGVQDLAYARGAGWQAVDLPYAEGFVMRLVLPDSGTSGPGAQDAVDAALALEAADPAPVQIVLPRWDHKSDFDLRQVFTDLGLQTMLQTQTDFGSIQHGLKIQAAAQSASITVAEKGTIAAAVSQINARAVSGVAATEVIRFDRPFLYEIVHVASGLPLFMGRVSDPRAAGA